MVFTFPGDSILEAQIFCATKLVTLLRISRPKILVLGKSGLKAKSKPPKPQPISTKTGGV